MIFQILTTAFSGMPTPEICFFLGQLKRTILPKERYGDSLSVGESETQPSNCEADTLPLGYRRPTEIPAQVLGGVMMSLWGVTEEPTTREKR